MPDIAKKVTTAAMLLSLVTLVCLVRPGVSNAEGDRLAISVAEGVKMLLENNLDVMIERISPKVATERVRSETGVFDIEAFGSFKREDAETPLNARSSAAALSLGSLKSESYDLSAGVSGKTPLGTEYTFEVTDGWTANTLNDFEFEYSSFTGITLTQPLLKDFGRDANEQSINLARKNRDISIHTLEKRLTDTVSAYLRAYWELVRARQELVVRTESRSLAERLLEQNRRKLAAGVTSALEVTQSEAAVAARANDVIVAGKNLREKENSLKLLISRDVFALRDTEIVPTDAPEVTDEEFDLESAIRAATASRPDYLETKAELDKSEIRIRYAKNQKHPTIDLEASYGLAGLGTDFGSSFSGIDDSPRWSVGVVARYPLGNRTATAELRAARLESEQFLVRLKKLEQEMILAVDGAIKDIWSDRERVLAARAAVELAGKSLDAEQKKLDAGRSTSYNVLLVQEDLAMARLNEIAALIDHMNSVVTFRQESGTLLEDLGINVKNGI